MLEYQKYFFLFWFPNFSSKILTVWNYFLKAPSDVGLESGIIVNKPQADSLLQADVRAKDNFHKDKHWKVALGRSLHEELEGSSKPPDL